MDFDFTPKTVNTTNVAQLITVTFHITDELSGFGYVYVVFKAPSTNQTISINPLREEDRISGTSNDGIYQRVIALPQFSEYGVWHLDALYVADALFNTRYLTESQVVALGFPTTFDNDPSAPAVGTPTPTGSPSTTATPVDTPTP